MDTPKLLFHQTLPSSPLPSPLLLLLPPLTNLSDGRKSSVSNLSLCRQDWAAAAAAGGDRTTTVPMSVCLCLLSLFCLFPKSAGRDRSARRRSAAILATRKQQKQQQTLQKVFRSAGHVVRAAAVNGITVKKLEIRLHCIPPRHFIRRSEVAAPLEAAEAAEEMAAVENHK